MKAGDVFFGGNYAELLAQGKEELPEEAKTGPYALGAIIMVARDAFASDYVLPGLPEWFPARVCLPPPVAGQWYRWYDPFIWFESEIPLHHPAESTPDNMGYIGKLWAPVPSRDNWDQWAYPIDEWKRLFAAPVEAKHD